jgi:hypothetical protein
VEKFAANRRIHMPDGSIGVRYSACTDPVLIAAPEGLIDPWLRTVTFFNGARPLVRLHYYASHPMSYYGKGHVNWDTVGIARERLQKEEGVPQIYFTGCAGNVAAGKYNDGSPEMRPVLADRLYQGMKGAIADTQKAKASEVIWKNTEVRFAPRLEPEFDEARLREELGNHITPRTHNGGIGMLAWKERLKLRPGIDISLYQIGPVRILHLPGEAFVEYQLYAQSLRPSDFIAVASYGDGSTGYICIDKAIAEGGYEPTASKVGPPTEERLKAGIHELLA